MLIGQESKGVRMWIGRDERIGRASMPGRAAAAVRRGSPCRGRRSKSARPLTRLIVRPAWIRIVGTGRAARRVARLALLRAAATIGPRADANRPLKPAKVFRTGFARLARRPKPLAPLAAVKTVPSRVWIAMTSAIA
jgi:hypothetical protein